MINIEDCLIGQLPSDYFQKLEKWQEEKGHLLDANNFLLHRGEIAFLKWFRKDKEIRDSMSKAIFPHIKRQIMEIKFDYIVRNIHFDKVSHVVLSLEDIEDKGSRTPSWIWSNNCEVIAKRRFTGLQDKNCKDIYEGDIILFSTGVRKKVKEEVKYEGGAWMPFWDMSIIDDEQGEWFDDKAGFKVLGNIYEHPELLTYNK